MISTTPNLRRRPKRLIRVRVRRARPREGGVITMMAVDAGLLDLAKALARTSAARDIKNHKRQSRSRANTDICQIQQRPSEQQVN